MMPIDITPTSFSFDLNNKINNDAMNGSMQKEIHMIKAVP